jgi:multicomponent Na+:H+ antiporter subunit D
MNFSPEILLQLCILLPLVATPAIIAAARRPDLREAITLSSSATLFYCVFKLYQNVANGIEVKIIWWEVLPELTLSLALEPLGVLFALVASFLWLITSIYSIGYMRAHHEKNQTRFYAYFALAIAVTMGIAFADNLFTLFIFYELLTLSTYPLVTHAGTDKAKNAGRVYLGLLLSTSIVFLLLAIGATWFYAGTLDFQPGGVFPADRDHFNAGVILMLFVFGIGKAAIMPFHRWLPAAMVAPTPVSALLHAVAVVKAGVFTLLKVAVSIFGIDLLAVLPTTQFLLYLSGFSVLVASLIAMRQDNLKARLAYSTISQLGYISIGALLATSAGVRGSAMHIATHAFGKITLFFCAGAILVAAHKSYISEMRGLGRQMPLTMTAFFIASLSIIGVPPTGGTWSKWYLLLGALDAQQMILMSVLMVSSLLNIVYLLPIPLHAFFPRLSANEAAAASTNNAPIKEAPPASLLAIGITTLGCVGLFVYPKPLFDLAGAILVPIGVDYGQ